MTANTTLQINILAKDDASKVIQNVNASASGLGKVLGDVGKIAGGFLAANVVAGGAQKVIGFFNDSVNAAKDLGESLNAVNKIFGDQSDVILDWGKNNATQFGLSQRAFNQLATPLGAMLKNSGIEDFSGATIELTKRAADMASVFNVDVDEALTAIQAGLRGESDPLERFGVGLSAAKVEARALADTGKTLASTLTDQEKTTARLAILFDQTASVAGDFADTSDDLANKQRIQQARSEELAATIGQKLIPIQLKITEAKLAMVDAIASHVIPAIEKFTAMISPLVENLYSLLRTGMTIDEWRTAIDRLPPSLQGVAEAAQHVAKFIHDNWPTIQAVFEFAAEYVKTRIEGMIQVIRSVVEIVTSVINLISALVHGDWSRAWQEMKDIASATIDLFVGYVRAAFGNIPEIILGLAGDAARAAGEWAQGIFDSVVRALSGLPARMAQIGRDAATSFLNSISVAGISVGDVAGAIGGLVGRADGGPVTSGHPYVVGERGPELFVPSQSGTIVPNGGAGVTINGPITVVANNPREFIEALSRFQADQLRLARRGLATA